MAAEMEQHRAPELVLAAYIEESRALAPVDVVVSSRSDLLLWPDVSLLQPLAPKLRTAGESNCSSTFAPPSGAYVEDDDLPETALPQLSHELSSVGGLCNAVLPVSPSVLRDVQLDARCMATNWSYEASQNMYALWTPPPALHVDVAMPSVMHLQGQHSVQFQQHYPLLLDQQLEPGLSLQMSPIHGSSLSPFGSVSATPAPLPPYPMPVVVQQPPQECGVLAGFSTPPTAANLSDIMASGDLSMFLAPNGSPTSLTKHYVRPMAHVGGTSSVKDLTLNELRPHFNKPMAVVAKELGVCITLMKKICRRNGLLRWPHRRIRSLVNRISSLQTLSSTATNVERKRFAGQIAGLRKELSTVIQNPNEKKSHKARTEHCQSLVRPERGSHPQVMDDFPIALIADDIGSQAGHRGNKSRFEENESHELDTRAKTDPKKKVKVAGGSSVHKLAARVRARTKNRKPSFGLHAHQPPPIEIPRHDKLPSISRSRSQSVPARKLRGDRQYGRGRDTCTDISVTGARPSTTTHRNGRRGSISSILNGIPE